MKIGRNDPCPCGSGKKHKQCCLNGASKQSQAVADDLKKILAMNPDLTIDELNLVAKQRVNESNNRPIDDFCGLSPTQMSNWLYGRLDELQDVTVSTPDDLSKSPVMRYLSLILDEAVANNGSFRATSKGNLPAKLVKQASDLLPEFPVSQFNTPVMISDFAGSNEDKVDALHYTRILASITEIVELRGGRYQVKTSVIDRYQSEGCHAFYLPMLEAAVCRYNWAYFDYWETDVDLRTFWLFLLWRIQSHGSIDQLMIEAATAFPDALNQLPDDQYESSTELFETLIDYRFIKRFLGFWGFVTVNPLRFRHGKPIPRIAEIQPLLKETFKFSV